MNLSQPDIEPVANWWGPRYRLRTTYSTGWRGLTGEWVAVTVPKGYVYDGSTEWLVAVLLPFLPVGLVWLLGLRADGPHRAAALVHDWLGSQRHLPREEIDWAFYQLCVAGGVARPMARLRWAAVRLVGWIPWILRGK